MTETNIKELVFKYIQKTELVLKELELVPYFSNLEEKRVRTVLEEGKRYFEDAKYYFQRERFETSLASVAYCEGLLDALRLLKLAEFS